MNNMFITFLICTLINIFIAIIILNISYHPNKIFGEGGHEGPQGNDGKTGPKGDTSDKITINSCKNVNKHISDITKIFKNDINNTCANRINRELNEFAEKNKNHFNFKLF